MTNLDYIDYTYNDRDFLEKILFIDKGKEGFFKNRDFIYDEYYDSYICPNDEFLTYKRKMPTGHRLYKSDPD